MFAFGRVSGSFDVSGYVGDPVYRVELYVGSWREVGKRGQAPSVRSTRRASQAKGARPLFPTLCQPFFPAS